MRVSPPIPMRDQHHPVEAGNAVPLVSVIIPMLDAAKTIDRTLASACGQSFKQIEIIVVDDGSCDGSLVIAQRHAQADPRIRVLSQPNAGVAAARNRGIAEARGNFIAPLDADDLWKPTKIEHQLAAMADPAVGLTYCWYSIIDADDRVRTDDCRSTAEGNVLEAMAMRNIVGHGSGALIRASALREIGGFDPSLRARGGEGCEDYKVYFCIAERHRFALVRECLVGYRETQANMSSDPRKALRSRDIVVPEFTERHPELEGVFHAGRLRIMRFMLGRAIRMRKPGDAAFLLREMLRSDAVLAVTNLGELAKGLYRSILRTGRAHRTF